MRRAARLASAALLAGWVVAGSAQAAAPALHCRHPLTMAASAADLPAAVTASLRKWMALHGEAWSRSDAIGPGQLTAGFDWAARSGKSWIVAYTVGGIACCRQRFNLFVAEAASPYHDVIPPAGRPDYFGDVSCAGIDPALDAYASAR
ncbi:MAG: hypothetical protein ACHP7N_08040 [Caulobacterales bacterium]